MTRIVYERPRFTEAEAVRWAAELYGLDATARALFGERDQNFLVRTRAAAPGSFVLKFAPADESREVLEFQNRVLTHLAGTELRGCFPEVRPARSGEALAGVPGTDGRQHLVRLLTFVPGRLWSAVKPHSRELLRSLGVFLGRLDAALGTFPGAVPARDFKWDLGRVGWIGEHVGEIGDARRRSMVEKFLERYEGHVRPALPGLRTGLIHNDANDYNVIVGGPAGSPRVSGLIDFGDALESRTVFDLAVALAYAAMGHSDPLAAAARVVEGYHSVFPLEELEVSLLHDLTALRLSTTVVNAALGRRVAPDDAYQTISEKAAWEVLERLATAHPRLATCRLREACGWSPCPESERVALWLEENGERAAPLIDVDLRREPVVVFDLGVGSDELADLADPGDAGALGRLLSGRLRAQGARAGVGRYGEARHLYPGGDYESPADEFPERRTVHLGIDLFLEPGAPVRAPFAGVVDVVGRDPGERGYGPAVILRHEVAGGIVFYTLYGHLDPECLERLEVGTEIAGGDLVGRVGATAVNGGWPPHLHFQVLCDRLDGGADYPGVAAPSQRAVWLSVCPDPNLILRIPEDRFPTPALDAPAVLAERRRRIGPSLSLSYRQPLHIVSGRGAFLYDADGQAWLDGVNNVCHVGHCHPRVVEAARRQMAILNTNTRYLHGSLVRYAERLTRTLPPPLDVCYFVSSGSEANELALRLARVHTGGRGVVVIDGAYHGNTNALVEISPYKFDGPGGGGAPAHVRKVPMPDVYRGLYRDDIRDAGARYAEHVRQALEDLRRAACPPAAFIGEPLLGCGGQIVPPPGYLEAAYAHARSAGAVCIADEVQVGFGRVGSRFWGFELQGVVPDIVTLGKPIGNGHPVGAVVTTPEIAATFANGMEYFNTFGGNPVSCAVGLAVLDVIEEEGLQRHALEVGEHLLDGLRRVERDRPAVGDVRGHGLFVGVELVRDRESREPWADAATYVVERAKDHGVLLSTDGPQHNVIKIKPPLVVSAADAERLVDVLDRVLEEDFVRQGAASP